MSLAVDRRYVRIRMAELGIETFDELVNKSGISLPTIKRLFAGENTTIDTLSKLAVTLEANVTDMLTYQEQEA
jgi:DNA-binding Xre family transcriptional regulator